MNAFEKALGASLTVKSVEEEALSMIAPADHALRTEIQIAAHEAQVGIAFFKGFFAARLGTDGKDGQ